MKMKKDSVITLPFCACIGLLSNLAKARASNDRPEEFGFTSPTRHAGLQCVGTGLLVAVMLAACASVHLAKSGATEGKHVGLPSGSGQVPIGKLCVSIEPSGLVWDEQHGLAICVHDEGRSELGYQLFAFYPDRVSSTGHIEAIPLLDRKTAKLLALDDLEGLTRLKDGTYYAVGSLSLDSNMKDRDQWARHQAFTFRIEVGKNGPKCVKLSRIQSSEGFDIRKWVLNKAGRDWAPSAHSKHAETGGLNVEGLASTVDGQLVFGFRGPLDGLTAPVLFAKSNPQAGTLEATKWMDLDVGGLTQGVTGKRERGIRGIERIPGEEDLFIVVLGHTGSEHHLLRLAIWDARNNILSDRGPLPPRFVAEGVAVMTNKGGRLKVLLVSDVGGTVLQKEIDL